MSFLTLFNESFARVVLDPSRLEKLVPRFYEVFLARSDRARQLFEGVEMEGQHAHLRVGLLQVGTFVTTGFSPTMALRRLAASHQAMGLTRGDYALWVECLIEALDDVDPPVKGDLADAWRVALAPAITFMQLPSSVPAAN